MKSLIYRSALAFSLAATPFMQAQAASPTDAAAHFHQLLRSAMPEALQSDAAMTALHMLPDGNIRLAEQAGTAREAMNLAHATAIENLVQETVRSASQSNAIPASGNLDAASADEILSKRPITIVIVPGIFGEFIPTRAFEDVLSQPSKESTDFVNKVAQARVSKSSSAVDKSFNLEALADREVPLTDVVHVGAIKSSNGKTVARVVLFYTPFMSLESMGGLKEHAAMFNRRLAKYLEITGPQDLAFVGYSRGTVLGLEMLAQAKEQKLAWLDQVKAMITLGGVIWGSSLADDTENPDSALAKALVQVKQLRNSVDPDSRTSTIWAWAKFTYGIAGLVPKLTSNANAPKSSDLKASPLSSGMDAKSMLSMVGMFWTRLGLSRPITGFSNNVRRFQALIDAVTDGVGQLTSNSRIDWWKNHVLPKSLTYYSLTAAMANPEASRLQKTLFDLSIGYSHRSYDDLSLLQNRLDYEALSHVALNDSQVSVPQAMFLPNFIAQLNPENAGLKTEMLGVMGTHHWGLALRVVNQMRDGRMNPVPREAILKALAAQVSEDLAQDGR